MFTNQCSKCGEAFETKNPKRVICPNCLYPEGAVAGPRPAAPPAPQFPPQHQQRPYQPQGGYNNQPRPNYGPPQQHQQRPYQPQGGYGPPQGGFQQQQQGGYGPPQRPMQGRPPGPGGFNQQRPGFGGPGGPRPGFGGPRPGFGGPRPQGMGGRPNFGPPRPGGFRPPGGPRPGGFGPRPGGPGRGGPKKLLVTKEQLIQIEGLYKTMLPLPNPDVHEVIGEKINLAPSKVFFGINLVREKMRLPKLEYPKRKLAVTPEQLMAIETLYEPYLPLPPIGIHKIISRQLKMDEWRVHVAIGLIRKNRNLARWNEDREDLPEEMRISQQKAKEEKLLAEQAKALAEAEKAAKKQLESAEPSDASAETIAAAEEASDVAGQQTSLLPEDAPENSDAPPSEVKKPRGRPPKAASPVDSDEAAQVVSSGNAEDTSAEDESSSDDAVKPLKAKTTRARKTASPDAEETTGDDASSVEDAKVPVAVAPRRGRPRKKAE